MMTRILLALLYIVGIEIHHGASRSSSYDEEAFRRRDRKSSQVDPDDDFTCLYQSE